MTAMREDMFLEVTSTRAPIAENMRLIIVSNPNSVSKPMRVRSEMQDRRWLKQNAHPCRNNLHLSRRTPEGKEGISKK